jgi:cytochrome c1
VGRSHRERRTSLPASVAADLVEVPPPRNFTCGVMMKDIPDGQLFWIIKNGSPGTGMMSFAGLSDEQVWQLIQYIQSLAK